jgi:hypothetical protein
MEFKGTKGPWIIGLGDPNGVKIDAHRIVSNDLDRWDVCAVWKDLDGDLANAKLISKAPEMLEMLGKLVERLEENDLGELNAVYQAKQLIKEATEI